MGKYFNIKSICLAIGIIVLVACSSTPGGLNIIKEESPSDVVERSIKCTMGDSIDFETLIDCHYVKVKKGQTLEEVKKQKIKEFNELIAFAKAFGGDISVVKEYKIISDSISEDGKSATVVVDVVNVRKKSKKEKRETLVRKLIKDEDGKWKILSEDLM